MSYLKFDKNLLINLDQSLPKEILRTNMAGSYHCTTVIGCNTRKQHGLLVTPIKEMSNDNYVLLSSLEPVSGSHMSQAECIHNTFSEDSLEYTATGMAHTVQTDTNTFANSIATQSRS